MLLKGSVSCFYRKLYQDYMTQLGIDIIQVKTDIVNCDIVSAFGSALRVTSGNFMWDLSI